MRKFTIFTTCRPLEGEADHIQRNAVISWKRLVPEPEVLIVGDEEGTDRLCADYNLQQVRGVRRNRWGIPYLSSLFWTGITWSKNDILCYVNSDIILFQDFSDAVQATANALTVFLMTGPRWDAKVRHLLDFKEGWGKRLRDYVVAEGKRHKPTGMDYFAFTRKSLGPDNFPPLAIGQTSWDAWLVWYAMKRKVPVVDVSPTVFAVHQHHHKGPRSEQQKMNYNIAQEDRLGHGYLWETNWRVIEKDGKIVCKKTANHLDLWAKYTGWTGWEAE